MYIRDIQEEIDSATKMKERALDRLSDLSDLMKVDSTLVLTNQAWNFLVGLAEAEARFSTLTNYQTFLSGAELEGVYHWAFQLTRNRNDAWSGRGNDIQRVYKDVEANTLEAILRYHKYKSNEKVESNS